MQSEWDLVVQDVAGAGVLKHIVLPQRRHQRTIAERVLGWLAGIGWWRR